eukprot:COSAG02_NODE_387_length_23294_cov_52.630610_13_plen_1964_part_00
MGANAEFQICNRVGILKQRPRMPPFVGTHQARLAAMIRSCLHHNPEKRPTAAQLVEAQLNMHRMIRHISQTRPGPVRESSEHLKGVTRWTDAVTKDFASSYGDQPDNRQFWTSAGQFTLHPSHYDSDSGKFALTVTDPDRNEWIENALTGDEETPAELHAPRETLPLEKLGIVFKRVHRSTGEKIDHWPNIAHVDERFLAAAFPEIRVGVKLEEINGQPVPRSFKEAVPLLRKRPYSLQFSTLGDAVESVLAPSKTFGVYAPMVAAAIKAGIQAAEMVNRFETGRLHRQTFQSLGNLQKLVSEKDEQLEKLQSQMLALESSVKQADGHSQTTESTEWVNFCCGHRGYFQNTDSKGVTLVRPSSSSISVQECVECTADCIHSNCSRKFQCWFEQAGRQDKERAVSSSSTVSPVATEELKETLRRSVGGNWETDLTQDLGIEIVSQLQFITIEEMLEHYGQRSTSVNTELVQAVEVATRTQQFVSSEQLESFGHAAKLEEDRLKTEKETLLRILEAMQAAAGGSSVSANYTDPAKTLYLAIQSGDHAKAESIVSSASQKDFTSPSKWEGRHSRLHAEGGKQFLRDGEIVQSEADADEATKGMCLVHVLARDCTSSNSDLISTAVGKSMPSEHSEWSKSSCILFAKYEDSRAAGLNVVQGWSRRASDAGSGSGRQYWIPLHFAARYSTSVAVIQSFLKFYSKDQLSCVDAKNRLPMHLAFQNPNKDVRDAVLEESSKYHLDLPMRIWVALRDDNLQLVERYVRDATAESFAEMSHWNHMDNGIVSTTSTIELGGPHAPRLPAAKATERLFALHVLARDCSDASLIQHAISVGGPKLLTLESAGPEQARPWDAEQFLQLRPVHYAAIYNPAALVMMELLKVEQTEQLEGRGLLHLSSWEKRKIPSPIELAAVCAKSPGVIDSMLSCDKHSTFNDQCTDCKQTAARRLTKRTRRNMLPIHLAAMFNPSVEVKNILVKRCESSLMHKDIDGRTPIHVAEASFDESLRRWPRLLGALMGRYSIDPGPATHCSRSAHVLSGKDERCPIEAPVKPSYIAVNADADKITVDDLADLSPIPDISIYAFFTDDDFDLESQGSSPFKALGEIEYINPEEESVWVRLLYSFSSFRLVSWDKLGDMVTSIDDLVEGAESKLAREEQLRQHKAWEKIRQAGIAIKKMKHREHFVAEINARCLPDGSLLDPSAVIEVLGWHIPAALELSLVDIAGRTPEQEPSTDTNFPYVLIMARGDRSLHDACAKERIAGYDFQSIRQAITEVLLCIKKLHDSGLCHGDIKQRNILRVGNDDGDGDGDDAEKQWILCDMDASTQFGQPIGAKTSSAYAPPELAQRKLTKSSEGLGVVESAEPSFDIWSVGVVIFELCSGRTLFSQDTNNDELIEWSAWQILSTWHTITDEQLMPVLKDARTQDGGVVDATTIKAAKNLIRWCLKGDSAARPQNIDQVISHAFFKTGQQVARKAGVEEQFLTFETIAESAEEIFHKWKCPIQRRLLPQQYHAFISHSQADASGTASTLYYAYRRSGVHAWLDMREKDVTLAGMRKGVYDSDIFVLILSQHVLAQWFCQQEILAALEFGKKIQIILEQEQRFFPFDVAAWTAVRHAMSQNDGAFEPLSSPASIRRDTNSKGLFVRMVSNTINIPTEVPEQICKAIDECLSDAITYRRRDFEFDAMMHALCKRNGLILSAPPSAQWPPGRAGDIDVFVIANDHSSDVLVELETELQSRSRERIAGRLNFIRASPQPEPTALRTADCILLCLSREILQSPYVDQLDYAIRLDEHAGIDRITAIYSETAGWSFGCPEHRSAREEIQQCLDAHEALIFRPKAYDTTCEHEFPAMVRQLERRLFTIAGSKKSLPIPASAVSNSEPGAPSRIRGSFVAETDASEALPPSRVQNWSEEDLATWLRDVMKLETVANAMLAEGGVDGAAALMMDKDDWKSLGASGLKASKIMSQLSKLQ